MKDEHLLSLDDYYKLKITDCVLVTKNHLRMKDSTSDIVILNTSSNLLREGECLYHYIHFHIIANEFINMIEFFHKNVKYRLITDEDFAYLWIVKVRTQYLTDLYFEGEQLGNV